MACRGTYRWGYCIVDKCLGHRGKNSGPAKLELPNVKAGNIIKASDIEAIRRAVIAELQRFNAHRNALTGGQGNYNYTINSMNSINPGDIIRATDVNKIYNDLQQTVIKPNANVNVGDIISWRDLGVKALEAYNKLRNECICHSDFKQKTCNCHNDCGCNY